MYQDYFWDVAERTEFYKEILEERRSYNKFGLKKFVDKLHLLTMVRRAKLIYKDKDLESFQKVFGSEKEKRI